MPASSHWRSMRYIWAISLRMKPVASGSLGLRLVKVAPSVGPAADPDDALVVLGIVRVGLVAIRLQITPLKSASSVFSSPCRATGASRRRRRPRAG